MMKVSLELEPEVVEALRVYRDVCGVDTMKEAAEDLVKEGLYVFGKYLKDLKEELDDRKESGE